ncbi:MAG: hypothetical protein COA41_19835 [Sphingopyxis sp.]|nr:MAG: hypothetical protein COA41_19835 [Sphingopyxis sp.]
MTKRGSVGRPAGGIPGDQITRDALSVTAGPIEAVSRMAAETKAAKAAAKRFWKLGENMILVPLSVGYATSEAAELTAGPMLALTRTAAAKTAAKAAATWFWMLLLIIM